MSSAGLVAILSVFGYGIVVALLGSIKLRLAERLKLDDAQVGRLFTALNLTSLVMVLVVGVLLDKYGHQPVIICGFALSALAVLLISRVPSYPLVVASCILLGIGGMGINTGGNTLLVPAIDAANPARASNLGNTFFGVGAFIIPLLTAFLFRRMKYGATVTVVAIILALPIIAAATAAYPEVSAEFQVSTFFKVLGTAAVLVGGIALFCYIGLEVSMGGWITTYLKSLQFPEGQASTILSGFWIALMVGRFVASFVLRGIAPERQAWVIVVLAFLAAITIGIMIVTRNRGLAAVATIATGLCFAPLFPTTVGVTFAHYEQSVHGSVFGAIFAIGLIGGSFLPAAIGSYSKGKSIQKSLTILAVAALVLCIIGIVMTKV